MNINLKTALLAVILLAFTYFYYLGGRTFNFLSLGSVIIFVLGCAVIFVLTTLLIGFGAYLLNSGIIYPNTGLLISLVFVVLLFVFWLVYGFVQLPRFADFSAYGIFIKQFLTSHLLYIAVCSVVIGGGVRLFLYGFQQVGVPETMQGNIKFIFYVLAALILSVLSFYWMKKIKQAPMNIEEQAYHSLPLAQQLLDTKGIHIASKPYYLPESKEVIILLEYPSSNKKVPIDQIFRIDKDGVIKDSLKISDLTTESLIFENGLLISQNSDKVYTWIFDRQTIALDKDKAAAKRKEIVPLAENAKAVELVYFKKTEKASCDAGTEEVWNGTKYYHILTKKDTLKIKVDNVYPKAPYGQCIEQAVEYYPLDDLGYGLVRIGENAYYVVAR
ncbi:hypothetical protein [Pedobacter sp.]|uniref:hypothetical protein n=1 Tax=Pedobacter sp. TaxID=1411316 RepID=UPI0031DA8718